MLGSNSKTLSKCLDVVLLCDTGPTTDEPRQRLECRDSPGSASSGAVDGVERSGGLIGRDEVSSTSNPQDTKEPTGLVERGGPG